MLYIELKRAKQVGRTYSCVIISHRYICGKKNCRKNQKKEGTRRNSDQK